MASVVVREYADIAVGNSKHIQAGAEPSNGDQPITTSGTSAPTAAFGAETRMIMVSTPPAQAVAVAFGTAPGVAPTALITNLRLPANSLISFGVRPGYRAAFIDVA